MNHDANTAIRCYHSYFTPAYFDKQITIDGVDVKLKLEDDGQHIVFPGSKSLMDWERDIASIEEVADPQLGPVGDGFLIGARDIFTFLSSSISISKDMKITFEGHSLGAARAVIQAALFLQNGYDPSLINIVVLGCPHPGGRQLLDIVSKASLFHAYHNGQDPVTQVPTEAMGGFPPPHTLNIDSQPVALDGWPLAMKYHHIQAYLVSLAIM